MKMEKALQELHEDSIKYLRALGPVVAFIFFVEINLTKIAFDYSQSGYQKSVPIPSFQIVIILGSASILLMALASFLSRAGFYEKSALKQMYSRANFCMFFSLLTFFFCISFFASNVWSVSEAWWKEGIIKPYNVTRGG